MTDDQFKALNRRFDKMDVRFDLLSKDVSAIKTCLGIANIDPETFRAAVFADQKA